jgi:hypothetical protein
MNEESNNNNNHDNINSTDNAATSNESTDNKDFSKAFDGITRKFSQKNTCVGTRLFQIMLDIAEYVADNLSSIEHSDLFTVLKNADVRQNRMGFYIVGGVPYLLCLIDSRHLSDEFEKPENTEVCNGRTLIGQQYLRRFNELNRNYHHGGDKFIGEFGPAGCEASCREKLKNDLLDISKTIKDDKKSLKFLVSCINKEFDSLTDLGDIKSSNFVEIEDYSKHGIRFKIDEREFFLCLMSLDSYQKNANTTDFFGIHQVFDCVNEETNGDYDDELNDMVVDMEEEGYLYLSDAESDEDEDDEEEEEEEEEKHEDKKAKI